MLYIIHIRSYRINLIVAWMISSMKLSPLLDDSLSLPLNVGEPHQLPLDQGQDRGVGVRDGDVGGVTGHLLHDLDQGVHHIPRCHIIPPA